MKILVYSPLRLKTNEHRNLNFKWAPSVFAKKKARAYVYHLNAIPGNTRRQPQRTGLPSHQVVKDTALLFCENKIQIRGEIKVRTFLLLLFVPFFLFSTDEALKISEKKVIFSLLNAMKSGVFVLLLKSLCTVEMISCLTLISSPQVMNSTHICIIHSIIVVASTFLDSVDLISNFSVMTFWGLRMNFPDASNFPSSENK